MKNNLVIAIAREFGSGGREIGKAANNEFILLEAGDFLNAK